MNMYLKTHNNEIGYGDRGGGEDIRNMYLVNKTTECPIGILKHKI